jgi:hypothetical protein
MSAHPIRDYHQGELVILVQVRPRQMLHEKAVFVSVPLAADGSNASDVEAQYASRLRDRLRTGGLAAEHRRLNGEGLTALVALDRNAEVFLVNGAQRDAVGTVSADVHGLPLT